MVVNSKRLNEHTLNRLQSLRQKSIMHIVGLQPHTIFFLGQNEGPGFGKNWRFLTPPYIQRNIRSLSLLPLSAKLNLFGKNDFLYRLCYVIAADVGCAILFIWNCSGMRDANLTLPSSQWKAVRSFVQKMPHFENIPTILTMLHQLEYFKTA